MAQEIARPKLVRRQPVAEPEPEDDGDDTGAIDTVEEEMAADEAPAPVRRTVVVPTVAKKAVAAPVVTRRVAAHAPVEEEPEDEPAPVAKKAVAVPAKKATPAPEPEDEPAPKPAVRKVDSVILDNVLTDVMELLSAGQAVLVTKIDETHWSIGPAGINQSKDVAAAANGKLRGQAFYDEVYTDEYKAFDAEWSAMTYNEKVAKAKKMNVTWQQDKSEQINLMRMVQAVREAMGITKYKPEYASSKARNAIRG